MALKHPPAPADFDFFRLSKSKTAVDVSPDVIRQWFREGLRCYRRGRLVFVRRSEVEKFILKAAS
jgi:hypothetical protein